MNPMQKVIRIAEKCNLFEKLWKIQLARFSVEHPSRCRNCAVKKRSRAGRQGRPPQGGVVTFEPIQHDHDFCERVVINLILDIT
ncbi:shaker protein [Danaus plexippus plexippus]|uniref:Shaker protein n=1 Tax=Danaus plexippus plexippus TaxID=278856 RepID=A0A212EGM6_DANPL|nr:shaker protein [Danaus plexippus plexippus]